MPNIIIGGDVCPIGRNENLFRCGQVTDIFNDILQDLKYADFSVVNLECPLIVERTPIEKDGAVLGAHAACIKGFAAAGIGALNLANNHILDHGELGLKSTLAVCQNEGIEYFGAGANLNEARKVLVREIGGIKVGFLGIAEHEFSIAGENTYGANPFDVVEIVRKLRTIRNDQIFLIILVHGGKEHYLYPSPKLQQLCRFMVEEGAGAVICQHSHCVACYEYFQGAPIVYGQGNFIFDPLQPRSLSWHKGILVSLTINEGHCYAEFKPFLQSMDKPGARYMCHEDGQSFLGDFEARSREILNEGVVQRKWLEYCRKEKYLYASRIRGHNRVLRVLNRKLHFGDWLYSGTTKRIQRNVVECETHREVLETLWHDLDTDF